MAVLAPQRLFCLHCVVLEAVGSMCCIVLLEVTSSYFMSLLSFCLRRGSCFQLLYIVTSLKKREVHVLQMKQHFRNLTKKELLKEAYTTDNHGAVTIQ